jgi:hypothetical protein
MTRYIAGVTRKNNSKCSNWIAQDGKATFEGGRFTSHEEDAQRYNTSEEAMKAAKAGCDSRERPIVKTV